jgi:hypothetical protein
MFRARVVWWALVWCQTVKMKLRTGFAALSILLLVVGGVARGASENHRESLRGLTGVSVRVERLSENAKQDGLDERGIQTDVEQKLKQAGIAVLTPAQAAQEPGSPTLYVFVNAKLLFYPTGVTFDPAGRAYNSPPYVVMVTVSLLQNVVSARDAKLPLREVKTWDAGYLRSLDPGLLKQARTTVGDLVDGFIGDWRAVNLKK